MKKVISLIAILLLPISIVKAEEIGNEAFDDANFYKCIVETYNQSNSAQKTVQDNLTDDELQTITRLDCSGTNKQDSEKIKSTKGLEKLTKLEFLYLNNNSINTIDLSKNTELKTLNLQSNALSTIDVSVNTKLTNLDLYNNSIDAINVSQNTELTSLNLTNNKISEIDVSKNTVLKILNLENNALSKIDVNANVSLTTLNLQKNKLNTIDLSKNLDVATLMLGKNNLLALDLQNNSNIKKRGYSETEYTNFEPQTREFILTKENNQYLLNLKEYDSTIEPEKVSFENVDGVTYDNKTGIFTITKEVESISYIYKTGLPSSEAEEEKVSEDMAVNLTLKYVKEDITEETPKEEVKEHEDEKTDNVQTGSITIGVITILILIGAITYYLIIKRKNKLYKL